MCVDFCFEKTLDYTSPAHGGWGIVRVTALVPESQILFITPSDCFRHGSLGAVQHGYKDKVAYLGLTPADVIAGYDNLMMEAMTEIIENPTHTIKAVFFFAGCIDDFVGTDKDAIARAMEAKYKDVMFIPCYMNPIDSDSKRPPMVSAMNSMMSVCIKAVQRGLIKAEKARTVNLLGSFALIPKENELFSFFAAHNIDKVYQVGEHETMESYYEMGRSILNVLLTPITRLAAENMKRELGIESVQTLISYDLNEIKESYELIEKVLSDDIAFDFSDIEKHTRQVISDTLKEVGQMPILVSGSAVLRPFSLAKALLEYGFNVTEISAQAAIAPDKEAFEYIKANYKNVKILQTQHHRAATMHLDEVREILAIGYEGAYLGNAGYVVDLVDDERMYGYYGVELLMQQMSEAVKEKTNLREMIEEYGAVV